MKAIYFITAIVILITSSGFVYRADDSDENELTDSRDGKVYKTVKIGDQMWMAENLRHDPAKTHTSYCYENQANNCEKYGRLYDWNIAKKVCPEGWHLPSKDEWKELISNYSDNETAYKNLIGDGSSGFNGTLHGVYSVAGNQFVTLNAHGSYWTTTEYNEERAWVQRFLNTTSDTYQSQALKVNGHACRCVKN